MTEQASPVLLPDSDGSFAERLRQPGSFTVCLALRAHYNSEPVAADTLRSRIAGCTAEGLAQDFFISDRLPGASELATEALARLVLEQGGEPVVSLSLATRERAESLDRARCWREAGVSNLLVVTGDYPSPGGREVPRFDLDSLQLLMLLKRSGGCAGAPPADLSVGCVVSPFKGLEAELMWQYARLRRKVEAGADFIVSQAGYDARAWDELIRFTRLEARERPVIATVLLPDDGLARRIAAGQVPGVSISSGHLERLASRGTRAGLLFAGAAVAVLRGLGYRGVLLGGRALGQDEVRIVLDEAGRLAAGWEERLGEFRDPTPRFAYFRKDEKTGLNEDRLAKVPGRVRSHPMYLFSYAVDHVAFGPVEPVFRLLTRACRFCDTRPVWYKALWWLEYLSKVPLYRCRMCGDCTLYACGFFCSESGCPKRMVNGPCGGSRDGRCEVPAAGTCMWVKAYGRLKAWTERPSFTAPPVPPKERRLEGTCSWVNFCLGRDHRKRCPPAV